MEMNYLIVAEQISFRNGKLSAINIWDKFAALRLPAKLNFDIVFICGPNWQAGEYDLTFKVKTMTSEPIQLGTIKANIANEKSIFNAIASNLNFVIENNSGDITFIVERNNEVIFERNYPVVNLLEVSMQQQKELSEV